MKKVGEVGNDKGPVLWAGGLSTAGARPQAVDKPTVASFGGSISLSGGGSISVSAKAS